MSINDIAFKKMYDKLLEKTDKNIEIQLFTIMGNDYNLDKRYFEDIIIVDDMPDYVSYAITRGPKGYMLVASELLFSDAEYKDLVIYRSSSLFLLKYKVRDSGKLFQEQKETILKVIHSIEYNDKTIQFNKKVVDFLNE